VTVDGEREQGRIRALEDLLHLRVPIPEAVKTLSGFGWDSPSDLVTLTSLDALAVLQAFGEGRLSIEEVTTWADAIEGREDVGFDKRSEMLLKEFVFTLANPELTEPFDSASAERWKQRLRQAG
jgi:hypothetical protein